MQRFVDLFSLWKVILSLVVRETAKELCAMMIECDWLCGGEFENEVPECRNVL